MNKVCVQIRTVSVALLGLWLGLALPAQAQYGGSRTGGTRGGGGGYRGGSAGSSSTRDYNNNSAIGNAIISSDPESRRLIVITDEETSQYIGQVITNLDRPKPQVLIKVVFMELTYNNASDIGFEGGFGNHSVNASDVFGLGALNTAATNIPLNSLGQPVQSFAPPGAGLYQVLGANYQATLRAIAQAGKAKILSKPSILARNNQPATILVGQSVPLITSVYYNTYGNAINGITYQDVGIILQVTPFITDDGMVEMIVSPEISAVSATTKVQIQAGAEAPAIDKRRADTVVVTPDNQTVIIGGLIQNQKTESVSKIPFLGDIPGLGVLFRHTSKADVKTELLIFLTPQIVQSPSQLAAMSNKEAAKSGGLNAPNDKGFTEKELNEFLETVPKKPENKGDTPALKK